MLMASPAAADLRLCNNTGGRVGIAIGYKDGEGWVTEGWWNLKPQHSARPCCAAPSLHSIIMSMAPMDERGGEWKGKAFMCTRDREFRIRRPDRIASSAASTAQAFSKSILARMRKAGPSS